ncbi:MAG: GNAT family N-acetyltransferase [Proteobacteria bacterium]|nr:GNAT family N-acetyltransferase [Pseudomonadota bacterium]
MASFDPTRTEVFRPTSEEMVWTLLAGGCSLDRVPDRGSGVHLRVAKLDGQIIGTYVVEAVEALTYRVVWIAVEEAFRGHGLGSWLLGHAIGIAESKGARLINAPAGYPGTLLNRIGFRPIEAQVESTDELQLALSPD